MLINEKYFIIVVIFIYRCTVRKYFGILSFRKTCQRQTSCFYFMSREFSKGISQIPKEKLYIKIK